MESRRKLNGTYQLVETKTQPEYVLPTKPYEFTLNKNTAGATSYVLQLPNQQNSLVTGTLEWSKTDGFGTLIGGSVWRLTRTGGSATEVRDNVGQSGYFGPDTDPAPGKFKINPVHLGTYSLQEIQAPPGFQITDTSVHELVVSKDPNSTGALAIVLDPYVNNRTVIRWEKTDSETKNAIAGSEWTVTNRSGTTVTVSDCIAADASQCTGKDADPRPGKFELRDFAQSVVPNDTYTVVESRAPAGYLIDRTPYTLVLSDTRYSIDSGAKRPYIVDNAAHAAVLDLGSRPNTPAVATVTWKKQYCSSKALPGSEWQLTLLDATGKPTGYALPHFGLQHPG